MTAEIIQRIKINRREGCGATVKPGFDKNEIGGLGQPFLFHRVICHGAQIG